MKCLSVLLQEPVKPGIFKAIQWNPIFSISYVSVYASYELTTIKHVIKSTDIHTFHIIG